MDFQIEEFAERFKKEYRFLYDSRDCVAGFNEAVDSFDEFIKGNGDFVREFAVYRGDMITSDREAAAFMFALSDMMDQAEKYVEHTSLSGRTDRYEIVDAIPRGYEIWNIGVANSPEGFLPLCRLSDRQPFDGGCAIDVESLKAIPCCKESAETIFKAVRCGCETLDKTKKIRDRLKRKNNRSYYEEYKLRALDKGLAEMEKLKWL